MKRNQYRDIIHEHFPDRLTIKLGETTLVYQKRLYKIGNEAEGGLVGGLRYGENPGQEAALYRLVNGNLALAGVQYVGPDDALVSALGEDDPSGTMMFGCGKHPSKTNMTDVDAGLGILRYLDARPAAVIIKHNNPCGAARAKSLKAAFSAAWNADQVAAFGGAVTLNRPVDKDCARLISGRYLEVVAAPDFEEGALDILLRRRDLRVFKIKRIDRLKDFAARRHLDIKSLMDGGLILQQSALNAIAAPGDFLPAAAEHDGRAFRAERRPTARELEDLLFGWAVEQGVTSNSVLFVKNGATVAIGAGGQDRVGIVETTIYKAYRNFQEKLCRRVLGRPFKDLELAAASDKVARRRVEEFQAAAREARGGLRGAVMVSDAFFPFRDSLDAALRHGVRAVAHPGGSLNDHEGILAVNQARPRAAMVFTGQRAFRH
ncbi:MAG: IMP cyclohydrolase [Candidatus Adiutrix sp.]|jgi:phosphoribosylaminoimidazolecarboxamide formyltransferase/IMP cyclohydrolase|nr:IMP cyclohydrolase [Candidatus Adiutrix sp.]